MEKEKDTKSKKKTEIIFNPELKEIFDEFDKLSPEEEAIVQEELSQAQRNKKKMNMRRLKSRIQRARKRSLKRRANTKTLERRARKSAISAMKKKFSKGKDLSKASASEKNKLERIVKRRKKIIDRAAKKNIRVKRAQERKRLSSSQEFTGNSLIETMNILWESISNNNK